MWDVIRPWILAARPKTLAAALVPVWIGTVLAERILGTNGISPGLAWCTLLSALAIQVGVNFRRRAQHPARLQRVTLPPQGRVKKAGSRASKPNTKPASRLAR